MISGLAHVSFSVSDLKKSIPFYRDLLGFRVGYDVEKVVQLRKPLLVFKGLAIGYRC